MLDKHMNEILKGQTYIYLVYLLSTILGDIPLSGVVLVLSLITLSIVFMNIAKYIINNPRG